MRMTGTLIGKGVLLFGIDNPGILKRQWGRVMRHALLELALLWWEMFMPLHFREGAQGKYHYKPRKRGTQYRRHKKWGHWALLVNYPQGRPPAGRRTLEGFMRKWPRLRAVSNTEATASWSAPGVSKQYREEAVLVDQADARALGRAFHGFILRMLTGKRCVGGYDRKTKTYRTVSRRDLVRLARRRIR